MATTILVVFIKLFMLVDQKIKPTVQAIAEAKAQELANRAVNNAVGEVIKDKIKYEDLMSLKLDKDGNVTVVQAKSICTKTQQIGGDSKCRK